MLKILECCSKIFHGKIRPPLIQEGKLSEGTLPKQEVRKALLSTRANQQVDLRGTALLNFREEIAERIRVIVLLLHRHLRAARLPARPASKVTGPVKRRTRHPSQTLADITGAKLIFRTAGKAKIALITPDIFARLQYFHLLVARSILAIRQPFRHGHQELK